MRIQELNQKGYIHINHYYYARKLRNVKYSLYQGRWSGNGCVGLEVMRDEDDKPMRFKSLIEITQYFSL